MCFKDLVDSLCICVLSSHKFQTKKQDSKLELKQGFAPQNEKSEQTQSQQGDWIWVS